MVMNKDVKQEMIIVQIDTKELLEVMKLSPLYICA